MKIGIIADDLTGANGTGVKLAKLGFHVTTIVNYNNMPSDAQTNAVVIDTDSRYTSEVVAANRVIKVVGNFKKWHADIIGKRIDSTIRGNIGIELDTLLENLEINTAIILTPSYPESHRIVSGGYLLVKGQPVQLSDVSKDPIKPVTNSYLPEVIQQQSKYKVGHIPLKIILEKEEVVANSIEKEISEGKKIIIVDGISDEDIEVVANAMVLVKNINLIPADPGPLTAAYIRAKNSEFKQQKKIIVTVGSITSNSHKQLNYLIEKRKLHAVYVNAKNLATTSMAWEREVEKAVITAKYVIKNQNIIIITTDSEEEGILNLKKIALKEKVSESYLAKRISDGLAKITRVLVMESEFEIGGCLTSGGDVTASVSSVGLVKGIRLNEEILPLIAYGYFIGGHFDGIPLVTKGGTAGDLHAIYSCVKFLESK